MLKLSTDVVSSKAGTSSDDEELSSSYLTNLFSEL